MLRKKSQGEWDLARTRLSDAEEMASIHYEAKLVHLEL